MRVAAADLENFSRRLFVRGVGRALPALMARSERYGARRRPPSLIAPSRSSRSAYCGHHRRPRQLDHPHHGNSGRRQRQGPRYHQPGPHRRSVHARERTADPLTHRDAVLIAYSGLFLRWSVAIKPANYPLFLCHTANIVAQSTQFYRSISYAFA